MRRVWASVPAAFGRTGSAARKGALASCAGASSFSPPRASAASSPPATRRVGDRCQGMPVAHPLRAVAAAAAVAVAVAAPILPRALPHYPAMTPPPDSAPGPSQHLRRIHCLPSPELAIKFCSNRLSPPRGSAVCKDAICRRLECTITLRDRCDRLRVPGFVQACTP